jgi:polar amino acid transport system substrate-binding protein
MRRSFLHALAACGLLAHVQALAAPGEHITLCFERQ